MTRGRRHALGVLCIVCALGAVAIVGAASASAANRFAAVGGDGPEPCLLSDPCSIENAVTNAPGTTDDITLLGGVPPAAPYTTTSTLLLGINDVLHGAPGARPVIQANVTGNDGISMDPQSVLRDVVVEYGGTNQSAVLLGNSSLLERVTARVTTASSTPTAACTTFNGAASNLAFEIRDSVCWNQESGAGSGIEARVSGTGSNTLTLRNVTAISTTERPGIFAPRSGTGALTVNATNVIAWSELAFDVEYPAGLPPTAVNLDHSNYNNENDPSNVITDPGAGTGNQIAVPVFVNRLGGNFHQEPTSTATINLGTATGLLPGELDFDGDARSIGGTPDIGADEFDPPPPPPTGAPLTSAVAETGERAAALNRCKRKAKKKDWSKKRLKRCLKQARQLPL